MDVFELRWSIQKLVPSRAYQKAGAPNEMWTNEHIKWRLIKEREHSQSIEDFKLEFQELKKGSHEDIRLRIQFVINNRYLDQSIKYTCYRGEYDLFFNGYFGSFEFVEQNEKYEWGLFLIKRLLGEQFILEDIRWISDPYYKNAQYKDEQENGVQLYCCGACGYDRLCGTWQVNVSRKGNTLGWDWGKDQDWKLSEFCFDVHQYQQSLAEYKAYLERKVKDIG